MCGPSYKKKSETISTGRDLAIAPHETIQYLIITFTYRLSTVVAVHLLRLSSSSKDIFLQIVYGAGYWLRKSWNGLIQLQRKMPASMMGHVQLYTVQASGNNDDNNSQCKIMRDAKRSSKCWINAQTAALPHCTRG